MHKLKIMPLMIEEKENIDANQLRYLGATSNRKQLWNADLLFYFLFFSKKDIIKTWLCQLK